MMHPPDKEELEELPPLYATEETPFADKIIHLHFYVAGCDWYAAEYDGEDLFFGFAILNNDFVMAEWGYFSYMELKELNDGLFEVSCDLHWEACPAGEIDKIQRCQRLLNA